jgi:hypothetical protein
VLDETRPGMVLTVGDLLLGDPASGRIDQCRATRGRALVESEDEIGSDDGSPCVAFRPEDRTSSPDVHAGDAHLPADALRVLAG